MQVFHTLNGYVPLYFNLHEHDINRLTGRLVARKRHGSETSLSISQLLSHVARSSDYIKWTHLTLVWVIFMTFIVKKRVLPGKSQFWSQETRPRRCYAKCA